MRLNVVASAAVLLLSLAACSQPAETVTHDLATAPADAFLAAIAAHCGQAYEGKVVQDTPAPTGKDPFAGQRLVMHVRGCADPAHELRIPFHVGDDHSRTWVLTRTP
ncbi:TPA: hypothetical protein QDZ63_004494, partial [Stenotrophomonas maltophilia]|nr:hypothetical protein [Stenotrophomonas maltophilia]